MVTVSNEDFLTACFGAGSLDNVHVTGFGEDPATLEGLGLRGFWGGNKWGRAGAWRGDFPNQNAYFCISTFRDDPGTGRARRVKALFDACHVIVIDDVGTKVQDTDKLPSPSWSLETSLGNYQWGYILATPETDAGRVNALLDGFVTAGIAFDGKDPGMKGVTRYVRLPEGVNTKRGGRFECRLDCWTPKLKFTIEQLALPWGIGLPVAGAIAAVGLGRVAVDHAKDEILGLMDRLGMVEGPRTGDGEGYIITCPWVDEHTDAAATGTAYWPGVGLGHIKCHHGHCEGKSFRDLERWADSVLVEESGGLARVSGWNFEVVPGYVPGPGTGPVAPVAPLAGTPAPVRPPILVGGAPRSPADRFFDDLIYVLGEDKFYSRRSGDLLTRAAVDVEWGRELVGALPTVGRGGQARDMTPSAWFAHVDNRGRARTADRLTYWPGEDVWVRDGDVVLVNRWAGVEGLRVGLGVRDQDVAEWLALVDLVTGRDGRDAREWLLDWMALVVGAPGLKPGWHVLVQGGQGLGKDLMARPLVAGVGRGNWTTVNARGLVGGFNPWAEARLCMVHELTAGTGEGSGKQYEVLKDLTETSNKWIKINQKNLREYYARNVVAFYGTSNDEGAMALEEKDRRFLVIMAGTEADTAPWGADRYARLAEWLEGKGGAALCAEWLVERWDAMGAARRIEMLGRAPGTAGKLAMIRATESPVVGWMRDMVDGGVWPDLMSGRDMTEAAASAARNGGAGFRFAPSGSVLGRVLRGLGGDKVYGGAPVRLRSGESARVWATREPRRFDGMGEPQVAQAYISARGAAFRDDVDENVVVPITPKT